METATYTTRPAEHDPHHGTFYYTTCCGNRLYSVRDKMAYDDKICPTCYYHYKMVTLKFDGGYDWNDVLREKANGKI